MWPPSSTHVFNYTTLLSFVYTACLLCARPGSESDYAEVQGRERGARQMSLTHQARNCIEVLRLAVLETILNKHIYRTHN